MISPTGLKQKLEILTSLSLAQALINLLMVFIFEFIGEIIPNIKGMFYDLITLNVGGLVLICGETKSLTEVCALPALFQLTLAMHLTPLPFFIPRCRRNTSEMPRQMCVCSAGASVSIWTV